MATTPVTGITLPNTTSTDQVPADLMSAFTAAELFWVGRFASSSVRDTKITSPTAGMVCFLTSPGKYVYYDGILAAWADLMNPTAWDTFTPTLQSVGGTAFTLGTGSSQIGRYRLTGKTCTFQCTWNFGSSVSGPGGSLVFSLPPGLPSANVAGLQQMGICSLYVPVTSGSGGDNFQGFWLINPNSSVVYPYFQRSSAVSSMAQFRDTTDGSTAGTGIPAITGASFNYPIQVNGFLTASGSYQIS